jgi:Tfp pilus assembly protein PilE
MTIDPNIVLGAVAIVGVAVGAIPSVSGYLEKKRRDEADEAERRRDHELRQAILRNDLVRDATAGQESTQYARRLRAVAAGEQPPKE